MPYLRQTFVSHRAGETFAVARAGFRNENNVPQGHRVTLIKGQPGDNVLALENIITGCDLVGVCVI